MYVKKLERVMTCDVASVVTFLVAEITQFIHSMSQYPGSVVPLAMLSPYMIYLNQNLNQKN